MLLTRKKRKVRVLRSPVDAIEIPGTFVAVDSITGEAIGEVVRTHVAALGIQNAYQRRTHNGATIVPSTLRLIITCKRREDFVPPPLDAA